MIYNVTWLWYFLYWCFGLILTMIAIMVVPLSLLLLGYVIIYTKHYENKVKNDNNVAYIGYSNWQHFGNYIIFKNVCKWHSRYRICCIITFPSPVSVSTQRTINKAWMNETWFCYLCYYLQGNVKCIIKTRTLITPVHAFCLITCAK